MQTVSKKTFAGAPIGAPCMAALKLGALTAVAAMTIASPAWSLPGTVWYFDDAVMSGGTSLNGNFTTDLVTGALEAWYITVNGGPYGTGSGYLLSSNIANVAVSSGPQDFEVANFGGGNITWSLDDSLAGRTLPTDIAASSFFCQACGNYSVSGASGLVAVPEPATWALMLVGFFGMGAALRSPRRAATAQAQANVPIQLK